MTKFRLFLLYSFPVVLFFSYYPIIPLGSSESMHFELSLPLIWLLLFSILSLKDFFLTFLDLFRKRSAKLFLLAFPIYLSLSIFWSANPLRGVLTAGILWCLYISASAILTTLHRPLNKDTLKKSLLYSAGLVSLLCWIQCFLDVRGVSRDTTLLCLGCTSQSFGFPHPSGFAIEPQFMGNLLLIPALLALFSFGQKTPSHFSLSFVLVSTLFLTFSRGAIYAFSIAYLFLLFGSLLRAQNFAFLKTLPLVIFSFIFTLLAQGVFAATSPTNDTFLSGIDKSISQLSLGKIELGLSNDDSEEPEPDEGTEEADDSLVEDNSSTFSGYVEESTNVRLSLDSFALELAASSPSRLLFGAGLGSAGTVLFEAGKTASKLEIVQNEFLSLLLEVGILGLIFLVIVVILLFVYIKKSFALPERLLLYAVILSLVLSLNFFSGLPNALHIYLFPVFLFSFLPSSSKHKSVID